MASIIKVDQIQSDSGSVNISSNLSSVTVSAGTEAPVKFVSSNYNEIVRLQSTTDATSWQQSITGYNAGNFYWQVYGGKDGSNAPFCGLAAGTNGTTTTLGLKLTGSGVVELPLGQLKFPASQNASSDANTLDDYEEGSWTPEIWSSAGQITSPSSVTGRYVKIGKLIYLQGYWYKSSGNSGGASGYTLRGLPYQLNANYDFIPCGYMAVNGSVSTQSNRFQVNASTYLDIYGQFSTTAWSSSYMEMSFCGVLQTTA